MEAYIDALIHTDDSEVGKNNMTDYKFFKHHGIMNGSTVFCYNFIVYPFSSCK